jgi:hypothetical protein
MLKMSTAVVPIFIVSLTGLACSDQSGLGLPGGSGGQPAEGSGGKVGGSAAGGSQAGVGGSQVGAGGSQAGSGGISGGQGCVFEPTCPALNCPYGYIPASSPCGCAQCAPAPDAGAGGVGLGGAIGSGGASSGGAGSGGTLSGGTGGTSSCTTVMCFLPACVGGEYQPDPTDPCACPICVRDGGASSDGGKKDASADGSPDVHVCGPVCDIYCQYGNVLDAWGCPTCQCKPAPGCPTGSHAVTCTSDTACTLDCSEYQRGADGCQLCACRTPATCAPPGTASCIYCPFGYRSGPGGCVTCSCADPPMGCAANSSDAGA